MKSPVREEEVSNPPKELPDRRMSMSWKKFNLKRQLSKVNMKIGINVNNDNDPTQKIASSVFYTQKELSPEDSDQSPPKDTIGVSLEARENMTEKNMTDVLDVQGESRLPFEKELTTQEYVFETVQHLSKQVDQSSRPTNLPLPSPMLSTGPSTSNDLVPPTRPPRQKFKEKREQRLLSVPNIKYQMRDMRSRTNRNDSSPPIISGTTGGIVSGTVIKKARKYWYLITLKLFLYEKKNILFSIYVCASLPSTTFNKSFLLTAFTKILQNIVYYR